MPILILILALVGLLSLAILLAGYVDCKGDLGLRVFSVLCIFMAEIILVSFSPLFVRFALELWPAEWGRIWKTLTGR